MSSSSSRSPSPASGRPSKATESSGKERGVSASDDDVWDPAVETHPRANGSPKTSNKSDGETTVSTAPAADASNTVQAAGNTSASPAVVSSTNWQAIYSPAHGAYYFYNAATQETTWTNPLVPDSSTADADAASPSTAAATQSTDLTASSSLADPTVSSPVPQPTTSTLRALPTVDELGGIDPELAFLDPSLAYTSSSKSTGAIPTFTAKFNAHTGRFASGAAATRDPNHVSEYERAKRMSEAYFDVDEWKKTVEERENAKKRELEDEGYDGGGKRSKKPTKADLVSCS